ncbi:hypothetical protein [Candidatus Magnetobacterium casense]|uniref:Magnetosome protein MamI n=1 Tax=Candidatus Magnetobacterium casense TaxID=1455061 RepID=A0ABS6S481_9BACT|nr:hypothetical protein [Candidatus Magnetobacterium casensis]MBV6343663.1 hypothetical protein [Candidatus Magnetobacterium casensis]
MTLTDKLSTSISCAASVIVVYVVYVLGSLYANGVMPDGVLFASMVGVIATIFGIKLGKTIVEAKAPTIEEKGPSVPFEKDIMEEE